MLIQGSSLTENTKENPLISVIILNYNGSDCLEQCLASVFSSCYSNFEVIVVDNGSSDCSAEKAVRKWDFKLIKKKQNTGFGDGNNLGIRAAQGEFLALLNNDTIVDPMWLNELIDALMQSRADFCQPKILVLGDSKIINSSGLTIHIAGFGILRGNGDVDYGQYNSQEEIHGFHGACVFASKKAIETVGFLDANFFAYNEDTDWSWRALLMGMKIVYVPTALIYHSYSETRQLATTVKTYYVERNRLIMLLTNYSKHTLVLLLPLLLLTEAAILGYCSLRRFLDSKILGYVDLFRMRDYIFKRRNLIQKERKQNDGMLLRMFTSNFKHPFFGRFCQPLNNLYALLYKLILYSLR